ncbi:MAG: insulinase family protein [Oscillospiraceae bacterium]|nr:insulinase family protein [Oscillospiraceae bacterium]
MEYARSEIMSGVWLTHIRTEKFKTACLSVNLLTQLRRETASMNALLPFVLRRGTARYADMEAISRRLDELYGTAVEPVVRRIGEIQSVGFFASVPEEAFLPAGADTLRGACELLGQLLCAPNTRGGLLLPQYVDSERDKLLENIRARLNDKIGWSISRCIEEMCCGEDYAVDRLGDEESAESIRYQKLTKQYRALLQESPIEIFYCGRAERRRVEGLLRDALSTLPRGEINYDIGTDVRFNALEAAPRRYSEQMNVAQAKLVIGWRLGEAMEDPDPAALRVFVSLFGGSTASKLFVNVREKLSLCYFASALCDRHKGVMLAYAGTETERVEEAKEEILAQLAAIARGEITPEELHAARADVRSALRAALDSPGELEGFTLSTVVSGADYTPEELGELVEDVTAEQLAAIARGCECDMIYTLIGDGSGEEGEEEEDAEITLSEEELRAFEEENDGDPVETV